MDYLEGRGRGQVGLRLAGVRGSRRHASCVSGGWHSSQHAPWQLRVGSLEGAPQPAELLSVRNGKDGMKRDRRLCHVL